MTSVEKIIQDKAYELGYEKCGIVPIEHLAGYDARLQERVGRVPESKTMYQNQNRLTQLPEKYPWAKSIVVAVYKYGRYQVPKEFEGHIGKHYIADGRVSPNTPESIMSAAMETFLQELGMKTAINRKFGIVGMRWAAMQAGLGIIRKNNFFYTESGSWVEIEAWMTDGDMALIETPPALPPCPENCTKCIDACPTRSLIAPYTMSPVKCISYLTTSGGRDLPNHPLSRDFGTWIYGCDACQDVCPMNTGKWENKVMNPQVMELASKLTLENILTMDEEYYRNNVQYRYFYISPDELWKWKVNALNCMRNNYQESYGPYILAAAKSEHEKIREMAALICSELSLQETGTHT